MKKIVTAVSLFFCVNSVAAFELKVPAQCDSNWASKTPMQQVAANKISKVYEAAGIDPGRCYGWTNLGSGDIWYDFSRELKIHAIDTVKSNYMGVWPLTRWPYEVDDAEVAAIYAVEGAQEGDVWDRYESNRYLNTETLGCLANIPLRYGDLESDGVNELVLPLGNNDQQVDWVVFSPTAGKIIFSARIALQDFFEAPDNAWAYYLSYAAGPKALMGKRAYAKLYFSDFDKNAKADILVWRKQYSSLTKKNSSGKGFELKHQNYRHYELINGEYLPQKTDSATIKNWLKTSKLTWQKGFPSTSECAGQKGQLIPEMHDVLLNDPDVLQ
ncbi:hypothetical protein [Marinagarivorans algicola]|uniref:hypothetical protein n=1 Tax=Marinagarivorans algicola TaxID=1513270 RepID=UPI00373663FB